MIKIFIQNYFMENMFHKINKTDNNKYMELHQQQGAAFLDENKHTAAISP